MSLNERFNARVERHDAELKQLAEKDGRLYMAIVGGTKRQLAKEVWRCLRTGTFRDLFDFKA